MHHSNIAELLSLASYRNPLDFAGQRLIVLEQNVRISRIRRSVLILGCLHLQLNVTGADQSKAYMEIEYQVFIWNPFGLCVDLITFRN